MMLSVASNSQPVLSSPTRIQRRMMLFGEWRRLLVACTNEHRVDQTVSRLTSAGVCDLHAEVAVLRNDNRNRGSEIADPIDGNILCSGKATIFDDSYLCIRIALGRQRSTGNKHGDSTVA